MSARLDATESACHQAEKLHKRAALAAYGGLYKLFLLDASLPLWLKACITFDGGKGFAFTSTQMFTCLHRLLAEAGDCVALKGTCKISSFEFWQQFG